MRLIRKNPWSDGREQVTPESVYLARRKFMTRGAVLGGVLALSSLLPSIGAAATSGHRRILQQKLRRYNSSSQSPSFTVPDELTPFRDASGYNNFYEFGLGKADPARFSQAFKTDPWSIEVSGAANKTGVFHLEDILAFHDIEERIYRLRCVEAWSMVIPWLGFPLADFIKRFEPASDAQYVVFETLYDPEQMLGQKDAFSSIKWPYVEGLRIDEAMNPLSFLSVGMYGKVLPNQNGAPIRLVVPWKYGFKSIKSIVRVHFQREQPVTTWQRAAPHEYGFYANVNPDVDHPRWSQKTERRLPASLFSKNRIPTQLFNGYAEHVAHLYQGLDLSKFY